MLNKIINQTSIIKILCIAMGLFSLVTQCLSISKFDSLPYFLMGISLSVIGFLSASKIKLFSPIYNFLNCIFFAYVFSGLYYFTQKEDVMGSPTLLQHTIWSEINLVYITFFLALTIPIFTYLLSIKKKIKMNFVIFVKGIDSKNINLKIFLFNLFFFISIIFALKYASMNIYDAFTQSAAFRHSISNGLVAIIYILVLATFSYIYIVVLNDIFSGQNKINKYNKIVLISLFLLWALICGSKGVLIFTGLFPLIAIYSFYKPIKLKHILCVTVGIVLILFYSAFLNIFRANAVNMIATGDYSILSKINIFKTLAGRNDNFANSIKFFKFIYINDSIIYFDDLHYKQEITNHHIKFLPKMIRNKITKSDCDLFGTEMSRFFYPEAVEIQNATFEFGAISNIFWCFGYTGLIIIGLMFSSFIVFCEMLFNKYKFNVNFLCFYFCILYPFIVSFCAVGLINVSPTMKLFYTIPHFIVIFCLLNLPLPFKLKRIKYVFK